MLHHRIRFLGGHQYALTKGVSQSQKKDQKWSTLGPRILSDCQAQRKNPTYTSCCLPWNENMAGMYRFQIRASKAQDLAIGLLWRYMRRPSRASQFMDLVGAIKQTSLSLTKFQKTYSMDQSSDVLQGSHHSSGANESDCRTHLSRWQPRNLR